MDSSLPQAAALPVTPRTTLKRHPERGSHERAAIDAILDEALVCHVAVNVTDADGVSMPCVLPTAHVRVGDVVYLHGARANRLLLAVASGAPACLTVTLLDGLVFARSAFTHSMNYRSVALYGAFGEVADLDEKGAALAALIEHMAPGRGTGTRAPSEAELRTTIVVKLAISEGSAKVRKGPPVDMQDDLQGACWAGVVPMRLCAQPPVAAPELPLDAPISPAVLARARALAPEAMPLYERTRDALCVSTDAARLDFARVHRFLAEESYWSRGVSQPGLAQALERSICFGLYEGAAQLGFARVVTDITRVAYLADVFVFAEARGRGLGKWLVQCVLEHPALADVQRWLLGTQDAHSLYTRFGFRPAPDGRFMVRVSVSGA